jgi:integrase
MCASMKPGTTQQPLASTVSRESDRALWATAVHAGLRRGELMAVRWEDVDLSQGLIRVERSYDPKEGQFVAPKSRAGPRRVPIASVLRGYLLEHRLRSGRATGLVFGESPEQPMDYWLTVRRAAKAWREASLGKIGLHEARHTAASLMIAAGVNAKALSVYASVTITLDRYGRRVHGPKRGAEGSGLDADVSLVRQEG